jgi:hypothetical protein
MNSRTVGLKTREVVRCPRKICSAKPTARCGKVTEVKSLALWMCSDFRTVVARSSARRRTRRPINWNAMRLKTFWVSSMPFSAKALAGLGNSRSYTGIQEPLSAPYCGWRALAEQWESNGVQVLERVRAIGRLAASGVIGSGRAQDSRSGPIESRFFN